MSREGRSTDPGHPREPRINLAAVARAAGTSESTASRALRDDPRIGAATRVTVRAAATRLGYVPNAAARSLRARRTHILGLLLDDLADPVHGQVAAGFEEAAASLGYAVFIMTGLHDPEREERAIQAFIEHRTDGIAVASAVTDPATVYARVARERVVFVQPDYPGLAEGVGPPDHGVIQTDDAAGVAAIVGHLVARGYRDIAYVGAGDGASDRIRRAAVSAAAALDGPAVRPIRWHDAGLNGWRDPSSVADALAADRPEAVICYDDKLALALMDGLRRRGLGIPGDIAIAGFDGIPLSGRSHPRLTTVAVPSVDVGRRAVAMLVASIRDGAMPLSEVVPVRLVIADSTPAHGDGGDGRAATTAIAGGLAG